MQSTSIPGVAQRTGATTYYIEIMPVPWHELAAKRPVLALAPGVGDVDIVLASELMEAGRTIAAGFVTPDRTLMLASTARSYLVVEKMAMADGRYDGARLVEGDRDAIAGPPPPRHGGAGQAERRDDQRGHARDHRRLRTAAVSGSGVRKRDPRRRQGRRC